ncbi:MAG: hypothetical protein ACRBDX_05125 [Gammaproteobacteria bacterium]
MDKNKTESRRDFLKTAGKFAVYTPPALMIMSNASAKDMYKSCGTLSKCNEGEQPNYGGSNSGGGWLQDLLNRL